MAVRMAMWSQAKTGRLTEAMESQEPVSSMVGSSWPIRTDIDSDKHQKTPLQRQLE